MPCKTCRRGWGSGGLSSSPDFAANLLRAQESAGQGGRPVPVLPTIISSLPTITWTFMAKLVAQLLVLSHHRKSSVPFWGAGRREEFPEPSTAFHLY